MRPSAVAPERRHRRAVNPLRLVVLIAFSTVLLVAAAPALGADVRVVLPQVPIDAQDTSFTVSGTAPIGAPDQQVATLVVVPRAGTSCDAPAPAPPIELSFQPVFVPAVGQVLVTGGGRPIGEFA